MQRTRQAFRRSIVPVLVIAAIAVAAVAYAAPNQPKTIWPNPNSADGTCDKNEGLCQTDNKTLTYHTDNSLDSGARTRVDNMMTNVENNTTFSVSEHTSPTLTGSSETDFIFEQDASKMSSSTGVGIALCDDPNGTVTCDQHYMYFRHDDPDRPLICHESGHGFGLVHGDQAWPALTKGDDLLNCMQDPAAQRAGYNFWGAHNTSWIEYIY